MAAAVVAVLACLAPGAVAAAGQGPVIVVFGDSITAGYNLPPDAGFVPQLEQSLGDRGLAATVVNASVSGDTTSAGRSRLDWSITGEPDLVILQLGGNDALRGLDPALTRENLGAIISTLRDRGIRVLLAGMLAPPNMGREYGSAFNAIYASLASEYGIPLYPFILDGVATHPGLNQADGIHPTREGVAVIVERFAPMIIAVLGGDAPAAVEDGVEP